MSAGGENVFDNCWLTVGTLKEWIIDFNLPDDAKVYVQMPDNLNINDLKNANLHDPIERPFDNTPENTICYVRAWSPKSWERGDKLYIEIYY